MNGMTPEEVLTKLREQIQEIVDGTRTHLNVLET